MKNAQCKRCLNKFHEKDIYTIQQLRYRKVPTYKWSVEFKKFDISEWDSFCERYIIDYSKESKNAWKKFEI